MLFDLCNQFSDISVLNDLECEFLLEKPTGRVVVVDGEPRTGNAVVRRRNIEKLERRRHVAELAGEHDRYPMHLVRSKHLGAFTGCGLLTCDDLRKGQLRSGHSQDGK
jgi:hypothetical protein